MAKKRANKGSKRKSGSQKIRQNKWQKRLLTWVVILTLFGVIGGYCYSLVFMPNVKLKRDFTYIFIPTGAAFNDVLDTLKKKEVIQDVTSFKFVANRLDYPENIFPGMYKVMDSMSNFELVSLLRSGRKETLKVALVKERTLDGLTKLFASKLEVTKPKLDSLLQDNDFLSEYGFNRNTIIAMFVPNTYEFYWDTDEKELFDRMFSEYNKFWNEDRLKRAKRLNLSPVEIATVASIVEEETNYKPEKSTIAGVYLNRFKKDMLLQADPTIRFALQDFSIKRIGGVHLEYDSPYNTYKYPGLPPGPICIPSIHSIEAVLDAEEHDYIFFCAKVGGKGHAFAKTYRQHQRNARQYRQYLSSINIF